MKLEEYQLDGRNNLPILKAIDLDDTTIVLLDTSNLAIPKEGYRNLLAVGNLNDIIWIADLPKSMSKFLASYWTIWYTNNELIALAGSIYCTIEIETGEILSERFER